MIKSKPGFHLLISISLLCIHMHELIFCNPINYGTTSPPLLPIAPLPLPAPMLVDSHYQDPYAPMQQPAQFFLAPHFGPLAFETDRRSFPGIFRHLEKKSIKPSSDPVESDEQKALEGVPLSFVSGIDKSSAHTYKILHGKPL